MCSCVAISRQQTLVEQQLVLRLHRDKMLIVGGVQDIKLGTH